MRNAGILLSIAGIYALGWLIQQPTVEAKPYTHEQLVDMGFYPIESSCRDHIYFGVGLADLCKDGESMGLNPENLYDYERDQLRHGNTNVHEFTKDRATVPYDPTPPGRH
jgi:hypothetical protein